MRYSIIIPVRDNIELTRNCVNSIQRNSQDYEILLIDSGSNAETKRGYDSLNIKTIISYQDPLGFGKAINTGMKKAQGEYWIILNNDTIVPPNWLQTLEQAYLKTKGLIGLTGADIDFGGGIAKHKNLFWWRNPSDLPRQVDYCGMQCLFSHNSVFRSVGFLDENFGLGYWEDGDYGIRAKRMGYTSTVVSLPGFQHIGQATTKKFIPDMVTLVTKNGRYLADKWGNQNSEITIKPEVIAKIDFDLNLKKGIEHVGKVSIMVLSWETKDATIKCIDSILGEIGLLNSAEIKTKFIVMDNGSKDGSQEYLKTAQGINKLILNSENLGISKARNQGIDQREGRYLFMVDSDISVVRGSFIAMLRYMEKMAWLSCLGAYSHQTTKDWNAQTKEIWELSKFTDGWCSHPGYPTAMTQYGVFKAEVFEKIRFDESGAFAGYGWGYEDNDLGMQMERAGFKIRRFDDIRYYHEIMSAERNFKKMGLSSKIGERAKYLEEKWKNK